MADLIINDFRNGMIGGQMGYRSDLSVYNTSAKLIENAVVGHSGGIEGRPGTSLLLKCEGAKMIVAFCISTEEQYVVVIYPKLIHIYERIENLRYIKISGDGYQIPHTEDEISDIKYAQDNTKLILVHINHPPLIIEKGEEGGISVRTISLDVSTDRIDETVNEDGSTTETNYQFDYNGLFTQNNFPSCVTFCANRLWFAASKENPGRLWASQPFKYNNFQDFEYYKEVDETVTTEQYLEAISNYSDKTTDNGDGTETRVTKTVSAEGFVIITTGTYDKETGELIGELKTEYFYYTQPATTWNEIVTEDSAMVLDVASDRNEQIKWIAYLSDIIAVGTSSSEWAMPYNINATSAQIYKIGSYGSSHNSKICYGGRNLFYVQSGSKKLRALSSNSNSLNFLEMTYACPSITIEGIVDMDWQRVQEPRLYCTLNDGTISVLCYDEDYSLNAWVKWTFGELKAICTCVIDTEDGQEVLVLFDNGNTCIFNENIYSDDEVPYKAVIVTNCIDGPSTLANIKKTFSVSVCTDGYPFKAGQDGLTITRPRVIDDRITTVYNYTRPTTQGLSMRIENIPGEKFIVHAIVTNAEAS